MGVFVYNGVVRIEPERPARTDRYVRAGVGKTGFCPLRRAGLFETAENGGVLRIRKNSTVGLSVSPLEILNLEARHLVGFCFDKRS